MNRNNYILGAGMTGLVAGFISGIPIHEANDFPGGICASYYIRPHDTKRLMIQPEDQDAYRFEMGGGHWIFGLDGNIINFIKQFSPLKRYDRLSSVYFHKKRLYVPYPLQNNLRFLSDNIIETVLEEIAQHRKYIPHTMKQWLEKNFGPTLCDLFFYPFNSLYTAGLYNQIAPQDTYKSPVDLDLVIKGASGITPSVGYNSTFLYPENGLDILVKKIAERCNIQYNKRLVSIDIKKRELIFNNNKSLTYNKVISTLPLNDTLHLCRLSTTNEQDPYTSVLVLNIGAKRGDLCPDDHWLYNFDTTSGFHRVGFYSNVDKSFLPRSSRSKDDKISIYVERTYGGSQFPSSAEINSYTNNVINELQNWAFIDEIEVIDTNWIDIAYTWSWPNSGWREEAIAELEEHEIYQVGRYGKWSFQGIADSIRDGLTIGSKIKQSG